MKRKSMIEANLYDYFEKEKAPHILLVENDKEAQTAATVAKLHGMESIVLPDFRATFGEDLRSWREELFALNSALKAYYQKISHLPSSISHSPSFLLIVPFHTLLYPLPKPELLETFSIAFGDDIDLEALKERLYAWGYSFVDVVETKGEVSIRGDIIDIFSPGADKPWRISLFDTEVESIRTFEVESQKSN